ncbi:MULTISPECIES: hypothetical protein [Streptosporangium]|uniref:Antibiotic biosynthesis monooxygenase (ABM) superfamily enzyme n=1 Tax=Streptosporangium brasiliense TaxID=47480 RepID=A0ABT9R193_9ACTN|nr:hypothetical protein [Streptosporangium brasiliense]MDP9862250.1 antibiotic biosynthesis monooxygenase (ABM) superfamily enzyme [Streptosporangium brasiliense]
MRTIRSAFSGWFGFGGETGQDPPPNWKQAMSVLLALHPTVMILNLTLSPALRVAHLPGDLALFVGNVVSVALLTWLLMPLVNRIFASWLLPGRAVSVSTSVAGALAMVLCSVLSAAAFGVITG